MRIVVFKVGGSLLGLPELGDLLEELLAERPGVAPLLVVGGGMAADLVRSWDQTHCLSQEQAHWMAVRAMGLNEALLRQLLPRCASVVSRQDIITQACNGRIPLLDSMRFLKADDQHADALPHCWDVTSDSIAAWAAVRFEAEELVLGKSVPFDRTRSITAAQSAGLIDGHFHRSAGRIATVSWANLRGPRDSKKNTVIPWLSFGDPRGEGCCVP